MIEKIIIVSIACNLAISLYLKVRQFKALYKKQTETTKKIADENQFIQMQAYNKDKLISDVIESIFSNVKDILVIHFRYLQFVYDTNFRNNSSFSELLFFLFYFNIERIVNLPFNALNTFFIEGRHGFNKTTIGVFINDFIKGSLICTLLVGLVVQIILKLVSAFSTFYLYLWIFLACFQLSMIVIYPLVIQPLFNKFTELEEGSLKEKISSLSSKVGFKASSIYVMDGSKRSGHSNAYFIGLTKEKRIVLYDTIIEQLSENEILAVLCHEFGHWYHSHTLKLVCKVLVEQLCYLYVINLILNCKSLDVLVFYGSEPVIIKLVYLSFVLSGLKYPLSYLSNTLSRRYEREADRFAVRQDYGKDLSSALIKLNTENKGNLNPDVLYSAFYYSHPTLIERLDLIQTEMEKKE